MGEEGIEILIGQTFQAAGGAPVIDPVFTYPTDTLVTDAVGLDGERPLGPDALAARNLLYRELTGDGAGIDAEHALCTPAEGSAIVNAAAAQGLGRTGNDQRIGDIGAIGIIAIRPVKSTGIILVPAAED